MSIGEQYIMAENILIDKDKVKTYYDTPCLLGTTITVHSTQDTIILQNIAGVYFGDNEITVTDPVGDVTTISTDLETSGTFTFDKIGLYTIRYSGTIKQRNPINLVVTAHSYSVAFYIGVVSNFEPLPKWNIATVLDRVFDLAEPHLLSVPPRFKLDPAQRARFEKIEAPEFAFTKKTLKEILDSVGGFIHGIPRLIKGESGQFDTIHYDMLGGMEQSDIIEQRYISQILSQNIEDYATELDSTVDNLVNTLTPEEGATVEPFSNGFKSVRSEQAYARIEEGNMVISTSLPIYSVQKLEVITPNGVTGDITPYVFEGAEYGRLSSFNNSYPTSKAYAIYYTLGERNIKGLAFKPPNRISSAFAPYAITAIIKAATGEDVDSKWWGEDSAGKYPRLSFRITYTPIFSARVLQHKPYVEPGAFKRTLIYNQAANLVETQYYGENLKGAIARMGNPELTRTYRMRNLSHCPKIGELVKYDGDDYYVASVTVAVYAESTDFTVGFSKDFNRLSQYVGINSEWRAYEVSERKAYNRDVIYRDFCVVGDPVDGDGKDLVSSEGIGAIAHTFSRTLASENITAAGVFVRDDQGNDRPVTLPVVSTAFGNALVFSFGMADNYSAGAKSVQQDPSNEITGYWQTDAPYVDYYGRVETMQFTLNSLGYFTTDQAEEMRFDLPAGQYFNPVAGFIATPNIFTTHPERFVVRKNGTEVLRFNYQLEFVSNKKEIIIGPALTRNSTLIRGNQLYDDVFPKPMHAAAVYVVNAPVGKFETRIDPTAATQIHAYYNNQPLISSRVIYLGDITSTASGAAWVIADVDTGDILLAQNMPIESGDTLHLPKLSFTHELP